MSESWRNSVSRIRKKRLLSFCTALIKTEGTTKVAYHSIVEHYVFLVTSNVYNESSKTTSNNSVGNAVSAFS